MLYYRDCSVSSSSSGVVKCKRVFQSVLHIAVEELCNAANALVTPITLGVAKPTPSFNLLSNNAVDVSYGVSSVRLVQYPALQ